MSGPGAHPTTFLPMAAGYPALVGHHRHLLDDRVRTTALLRAVAATVRRGDVVVDLGTGSGILAIAARRAGARAVYAIDLDPIVRVAAAVARANGVDGITFLEQAARDVRLPVRADVLISEPFGPFAIGGTMLRAFTELRDRVLVPGGRVIPAAVDLLVAPVEAPALARYIGAFRRPRYGVDWRVAQALASNNVYSTVVTPPMLLARAGRLHALDLVRDGWTGSLDASVDVTATRAGRVHAIAGWFRATLGGGATLSTAPGRPPTIWRQVAFPLEQSVAIRRGAPITIRLTCHGGEHFDWRGRIGDTEFAGSTRYSYPAALDLAAITAAPRASRRGRSGAAPKHAAR